MDIISEVLIGIGLAMDAAAVSVAGGANTNRTKKYKDDPKARARLKLKASILAALFFGGFQAGMLAIGILGGEALKTVVAGVDHWIAFGLLSIVGGKMLVESFRNSQSCEGEKPKPVDLLDSRTLVLLAIATSIDALAVGAGIAFTTHTLVSAALIVGLVTAMLSFACVFIGSICGDHVGRRIEVLGGIILIVIGLNILLAHLSG